MITAIYSFGSVRGIEPWILFWVASLALYFILAFLIKSNRSKVGLKNLLVGLLAAEIIFDLVWAGIYYFNRSYLEFGVGITYGFAIWLTLLLATIIAATVKNTKKVRK